MVKIDKRIKVYLKNLMKYLFISKRAKKVLTDGGCSELLDYVQEHPGANYQQIRNDYGDPQKVAQDLLESAGVSETVIHRKRKRIIIGSIIILFSLLVIFMSIWIITLRGDTSVEVIETVVIHANGNSSHNTEE